MTVIDPTFSVPTSFDECVPQWRADVRALAHRWANVPGLERDDLEQIAWIGLWEAWRQYQPGSAPFVAWARRIMRFHVLDAVRTHHRRNRGLAQWAVSGNGEHTVLSRAIPIDPIRQWVEVETLRERLRTLTARLTPLERQVLSHLLQEEGPVAIARLLRLPYKTVDNACQRIRRKARRIWGRET